MGTKYACGQCATTQIPEFDERLGDAVAVPDLPPQRERLFGEPQRLGGVALLVGQPTEIE